VNDVGLRQGRRHLDDRDTAVVELDDLGPASWLQICEGGEQDLLLCGKRRQPFEVGTALELVLGDDLEDQRFLADAVRHRGLDVCRRRHGRKLRVGVCVC
jgi:hypothetical protein